MAKRIALFGGSFNPPTDRHVEAVLELKKRFDEVRVVPCGPRPDKLTVTDVDPIHRAVMIDLAFGGIPGVEVDLFDLESPVYTSTRALDGKFGTTDEIWHAVGADLIEPGTDGLSAIERSWDDGPSIWRNLRFAVLSRQGYRLPAERLPPRAQVIGLSAAAGSSTEVRERAFRRESLAGLTPPKVAAYIERYNLYRGARPASSGPYPIESPRLLIEKAWNNPRADAVERLLAPYVDAENPNAIVVLGGDGMMLRAIRQHWKRRLPFVGFNAGHRGFLHNEPEHAIDVPAFFARMRTYHLSLLRVDATLPGGEERTDYAFNDVWIERMERFLSTELRVNGIVRAEKLVCDVVVAASPAGSTAYARVLGATPMNLDRPGLVLAASAVESPRGWRHVELPGDAEIEFRLRDLSDRSRESRACFDNVKIGPVERLRIRTSQIASVELGFAPDNDLAEKRIAIQFPD